jgi:hypothetical protein
MAIWFRWGGEGSIVGWMDRWQEVVSLNNVSLGICNPWLLCLLDDMSLWWCVPWIMHPPLHDWWVLLHWDRMTFWWARLRTYDGCRQPNITQNTLSWQVPQCSPGSGHIGQERCVQGPHHPKCPSDGTSVTFCLRTDKLFGDTSSWHRWFRWGESVPLKG